MEIAPESAEAYVSLGNVLERQGKSAEAIAQYQKALALKPDCAEAYLSLGVALKDQGKLAEAADHYRKALAIKPDYTDAHVRLGTALARQGEYDAAMACLGKALAIQPDCIEAHVNLGAVLVRLNRLDDAARQFRAALMLSPHHPEASRNLDLVLAAQEGVLQQIAAQRQSLEANSNDGAALNDLAWTLATSPHTAVRNGAEAVALAERAAKLSGSQEPAILGTLAAAYAESGRFTEAVETAEEALALAAQRNNPKLVKSIEAKLSLYRSGAPYRQPPANTSPKR